MDFGAHYSRLMTEIFQYANEGTKFMIDKGWIEQPPLSVEREALKNRHYIKNKSAYRFPYCNNQLAYPIRIKPTFSYSIGNQD
jgi:hypothetical protein